jgi:signal transduction histidine kinase
VTVEGGSPGAAGVGSDVACGRGRTGTMAMPREDGGAHRGHDADQIQRQWSAIGHELRTPLNAILGHVGLLLEGVGGPLSAEARACLGDVQAAGHRLMRQIDWLLLLAQVQAVAPRMDARVELAGLVRAALQRCGMVAQARGDVALWIRGDALWLEVLAGAVAGLCRDGGAAGCSGPPLRLEVVLRPETSAGELRLVAPRPVAFAAEPLPWRLIEVIAARHGGEAGAAEQGLWLKWPQTG